MGKPVERELEQALAAHRAGREAEAFRGYRKVLRSAPNQIDALMNLAALVGTRGDANEAARLLERARAVAPRIGEVHRDAGSIYIELARWDEALAATRRATQLDPRDALAWANLGHVYVENGQREEGVAALEKAIALSPGLAPAWFTLQVARFDDANLGPAIEAAQRAVALKPDDVWYRFCLGAALGIAGREDAMRAELAKVGAERGQFRGAVDSVDYVMARRTPSTRFFATTRDALLFGLRAARGDGLVLELGVRHGCSIRWIASQVSGPVHGFDSFEGLPESWHITEKGAYTTRGQLPAVPAQVQLHVGLFADTLPSFCAEHAEPVRYVNVDCDLYSSTVTMFDHLGARIGPGTVLVFDEYIVNDRWREDEHKAFQEAVAKYGWRYEYLAFSFVTMQSVVRIL